MNLRKTEDFIADVERQFDWYDVNGGWELAEHYLATVEATCELLGRNPFLGPVLRTKEPRLQGWRFFVVFRPFNKHLLFYDLADDEVLMRRAIHGNRNLKRRLVKPPSH
jgi:plasmid stabilization system protein ParE